MLEQTARAFDVDPKQLGIVGDMSWDRGRAVNDGVERARRQKLRLREIDAFDAEACLPIESGRPRPQH